MNLKPYFICCNINMDRTFSFLSAVEAWAALVEKGGLDPYNCCSKRVLIHAGSGGFGSIAIQLVKGESLESRRESSFVDLLFSELL